MFCKISNHSAFFLQSGFHGGVEVSTFEAYALAHKGKATTSNLAYNPDDPPEVYCYPGVHRRLTDYTEVAREVHGADYDPRAHDLDPEIVVRAGQGRKHGRYYLGDSVLSTAGTPSLSTLRARSTGSTPAIRQRPTSSDVHVAELQVRNFSFLVH